MKKIKKENINLPLEVNDMVYLIDMPDDPHPVLPGTEGIVISVSKLSDAYIYTVQWEDGRLLALLSDVDVWYKIPPDSVNESSRSSVEFHDFLFDNSDIVKFYNVRFLQEYLLKLRECSVTNMLGAAPYLYMGKNRMITDFEYHMVDSEVCDEVLEMADDAKNEMISGTVKFLNDKGEKIDVDKVSNLMRRNANKILVWYIRMI